MGNETGRRIWALTVECGAAKSRPRRMRIDFIFTRNLAVRNAERGPWLSGLTLWKRNIFLVCVRNV